MRKTYKDEFYDILKEPTRDHFREFIKNNLGEKDYVDFKKEWISKEKIIKHMLAMGNSGGGVLVFGIEEKKDGTLNPVGLDLLKDPADLKNEIKPFVPSKLKYELIDLCYDSSEYEKLNNKKFQILIIDDGVLFAPLVCLHDSTGIKDGDIYVRKGTQSEKANSDDIDGIILNRLSKSKIARVKDISLEEHLNQLELLYSKLEYTIREGGSIFAFPDTFEKVWGKPKTKKRDEYPKEDYYSFIARMIEVKKSRIEEEIDVSR